MTDSTYMLLHTWTAAPLREAPYSAQFAWSSTIQHSIPNTSSGQSHHAHASKYRCPSGLSSRIDNLQSLQQQLYSIPWEHRLLKILHHSFEPYALNTSISIVQKVQTPTRIDTIPNPHLPTRCTTLLTPSTSRPVSTRLPIPFQMKHSNTSDIDVPQLSVHALLVPIPPRNHACVNTSQCLDIPCLTMNNYCFRNSKILCIFYTTYIRTILLLYYLYDKVLLFVLILPLWLYWLYFV